jgi:tetratricopeptide (TPR) repeat protein
MSKLKWLFLPLCAAVLIAASYLAITRDRADATTAPPAGYYLDDSRFGQPGANQPDADTAIAFWQKRAGTSPRGYIEYSLLGEAFARKARETGDVDYYQRAEAALRRSLEINPKYVQTLALLASVRFAMHDFQGALNLAEPLVDQSKAWSALATVGDAYLALGRYTQADSAYQTLFARSPSPAVYSRLAALADLQGDPDRALSLMQQALNLAEQAGESGQSLAWYQYQLGDFYFRTGQLALAGEHFESALAEFDNYYLALAGLARVSAAQGEYDQAIQLYQEAIAIIPQPEFLAALGDVYTITGQADQAQLQYDTVDYIGKLAQLNQQVYNRQLANFYTDHNLHLDQALKLAASELEIRQDIHGLDTAAWSYYKMGQIDQARSLSDQALQLGTHDAKLFYHAGMIAQAQGRSVEARQLLTEALAINPYFDLLQAPLARAALAQLQAD